MGDDIETQVAMGGDPTRARNLRRIADALGVPEADFYGPVTSDREALALLTLVQTYFAQADSEARERFVRAVQAMNYQQAI